MQTYTVQIPVTVTVTIDHDRPENAHMIPHYDAYESALEIIDAIIANHSNVQFTDVSDSFDVFDVVRRHA